MTVFLGLYYLLLEREKMHFFNRFYLLVALVFSLALPFISFTLYEEVVEAEQFFSGSIPTQADVAPVTEAVDYTPYILLGFYLTVAVVLIFRFIKNLLYFKKAVSVNTTVKHKGATLVLLTEKVLPHTFLHYIFINRQEYEDRLIEDDLFTHELTHVNQRHTLDILFMEVLLTIFWFNPLLYFYKKAIKLNHEFLADESVVSHTHNVIDYQKLLLQKAVPATQYHLASSLNFSVTKKRLLMMRKATPKSKALLLKLAALPVVALLVYTLCTETVAQTTEVKAISNHGVNKLDSDKNAARDSYYKGVRVRVYNSDKVKLFHKPYEELTEVEKDKYLPPLPKPMQRRPPTAKEFEDLKNADKYLVTINLKEVDNKELNKYRAGDFAIYVNDTRHQQQVGKDHPQRTPFILLTNEFFKRNVEESCKKFDFETYTAVMLKDEKTGILKSEMVPAYMGLSQFFKSKQIKTTNAAKKTELLSGLIVKSISKHSET